MATVAGVRIAPSEHCLQTATVALLSFVSFFITPVWAFILFGLLFTRFYWLTIAYATWYVYDWGQQCRGGRRIDWVRRWRLWRYFRGYFPMELIKTAELDPKKSYIFGCHPHGIGCISFVCHFSTEGSGFSEEFPGIIPHLITLDFQYYWPVHREYFMASGACGCSKEAIKYILEKKGPGSAVAIPIGGPPETLQAHPGNFTLYILRRTGFLKLALETGTSIVPVFSFGENDLFSQFASPEGSWVQWFHKTLAKLDEGAVFPLFYGQGLSDNSFGFLPRRKAVYTVVGKPIEVAKVEAPTREQVLALQRDYLDALEQLFEEHKVRCGVSHDQKLRFI